MIRLRACAGWSEPLWDEHTTLLEIKSRGSIIYFTNGKHIHLSDDSLGEHVSVTDIELWLALLFISIVNNGSVI